ncbi:MAG: family metallopeptidase [Alphaproteobacteria bacterium]|jgi:hypothetical protein|nr:family metallopeptidase [Alphaproteobacteria bacterium]
MSATNFENSPSSFKVRQLSQNEKQAMQESGVWKEGCPVPLDRLRVVEFSYSYLKKDNENSWSFNGDRKHDGKIVVLEAAADYVCMIFEKLYQINFPIHKACPMEDYGANDEKSMADNNSSSFNFREITGGGLPSIHSYGLAIDLNPLQNPYISFLDDKDIQGDGNAKILPQSGCSYINRTNLRTGMIESCERGNAVIKIFKEHGFPEWGGNWNTPIDWMHFQTSRTIGQLLVAMNPDDAIILFKKYVEDSDLLNKANPKNNQFVSLYNTYRVKFMELLKNNPTFLKMSADEALSLMS